LILYRYNPLLEKEGKNFEKLQEFHDLEVRFTSLKKAFPERAKELQEEALQNARWRYNFCWRYNFYKRQAEIDYSEED